MNLTEEELTKMALLKAEADKVKINTGVSDIPEGPGNNYDQKDQNARTSEDVRVEEPDTKYSTLNLGGSIDKKINYSFWTGKTKKMFNTLIDNTNDDNFYKLTDLLIRDYIKEKDVYLSPIEEQYLIIKLRERSLTDEFIFNSTCPNCGNTQEIRTSTNIIKFVPNSYPRDFKDYTFVDIDSYSTYRNNISRYKQSIDYDPLTSEGDCEYAMHIQKEGSDFIDILNDIDNMSLKYINELMTELKKCSAHIDIVSEQKCTNCNEIVKFETDDLPNIFEELI